MANRPDTKKRKEIAERQKAALALALKGLTRREIGEQLGVSHSTIVQDIKAALRDIPKEEADTLRAKESARLDKLQAAVWDRALDGYLYAVDRAVKIIDRRAKLLGLDAPQQVEVSSGDVDLDGTVEKLLQVAKIAAAGGTGEVADALGGGDALEEDGEEWA